MIETAEAGSGDPIATGRAIHSDHILVRAIQRVPTGVRSKLLIALFGGVVLLVIVAVLGLRAIAESNDRAEALRSLQQRGAAYRGLQTAVEEVRFLIALRAGGPDLQTYVGATPSAAPSSESLANLDEAIATTITTRLGPGGDVGNLGFAPTAPEQALVDQIAADETQLSDVMAQIHGLDQSSQTAPATQLQGSRAEPLVHDLESLADRLVGSTSVATEALILQDRTSPADAERTFVVVATLSVLLA